MIRFGDEVLGVPSASHGRMLVSALNRCFVGSHPVFGDERYSSQMCSACKALSGPRGIAQLGVREWTCGGCGTFHDRDTNASLNILLGPERRPPAVEIPAF